MIISQLFLLPMFTAVGLLISHCVGFLRALPSLAPINFDAMILQQSSSSGCEGLVVFIKSAATKLAGHLHDVSYRYRHQIQVYAWENLAHDDIAASGKGRTNSWMHGQRS